MTTHSRRLLIALLACLTLASGSGASLAQITTSKHNLSVSGPGPVKALEEKEICIFCHTPHNARRDVPYLWNRADSTVNYTTYESSTLYATVGQPSGSSKLCLSCHDGTIALGAVLSRPGAIAFPTGLEFLPEGPTRLGTDLSDDHPVSFVYDESLASRQGELASPSTLTGAVKLDATGQVQCTACHDPHDDAFGKFLVDVNRFSSLCVSCHRPRDWNFSAHALSFATWNGAPPDPWPHTAFATVAENGCGNCHSPHNAGRHAGLLNYAIEEDNCLGCHNGNVAAQDIHADLAKPFAHRVRDYIGVHDPAESFTGPLSTHVECADCHNLHRVSDLAASAPEVSGALSGVKGVTASGAEVPEATFSYEICFKCHADNDFVGVAEIARQHPQLNARLEFDVTSASYHPVEAVGKNAVVPSLISPLTVNSILYCTDCHNSDDGPAAGGSGLAGPHGSNHRFLLERNYTTADFTTETSYHYDLCYKCHDRNSILADESFAGDAGHNRHLVDVQAPCSACHDPHGISSTQGNEFNNSHLINFDINIVFPNQVGALRFDDLGTLAGACSLTCHGKEHDNEVYP